MISHKSQLLGNIEVFDSEGTLKYNKPLGMKEKKPDRLILKVKDKLGKLKRKKILPFKSFNEKYTSVLNYALQGESDKSTSSSPEKIEATDGVGLTADEYNLELTAASSNTDYGVVIGTGTADPDWTDNDLVSQEKTDWDYQNTSITMKKSTPGGDWYNGIKITRRFTNNTGGSKTIKEVGLVCITNDNDEYFLIARDNKDGDLNYSGNDVNALDNISIEVGDGEILEVTYLFYIDKVENGVGFTSNWLSIIGSKMKADAVSVKAADGTQADIDFSIASDTTDVTAGDGITTHGLIISRNFASPSISDYTTISKIDDGSSDGQLEYKAMQAIDMEQKDVNGVYYSQMGFYREFENASKTALIVQDVNLVTYNTRSGKYYLIARSLTGGVQLEVGDTLRISMYIKHILDDRTASGGPHPLS